MRNFHECHVNKLHFEHSGDRLAPALNVVSRDRKSTSARQAATQGKGSGNEAGRPENVNPFWPPTEHCYGKPIKNLPMGPWSKAHGLS